MNKVKKLLNSKLFWLQTAFVVSLVAVIGSLMLEFALDLLPCELCWYQRAFMYPLPFILGAALIQKRFDVFWYAFPLVVVGAVIAAYHYLLQMTATDSLVCSPSLISCTEKQIDILGFITIPFGSLIAFAAIGFSLWMLKRSK